MTMMVMMFIVDRRGVIDGIGSEGAGFRHQNDLYAEQHDQGPNEEGNNDASTAYGTPLHKTTSTAVILMMHLFPRFLMFIQ